MELTPLEPGPARSIPDLVAEMDPRGRAGEDRPFVYMNFVSTVDGRAAHDGSTRALGGEADLELLLELRVLSDAVLIGSGTLRAEGYDRLVRGEPRRAARIAAGLAEDPLAVVLTRRFDVPWNAGLFQAPEQTVLVYTGAEGSPPDVPATVEVIRLADPRPAAALADLRERGVRALLCEGGPTMFGALLADGAVDELFLTIAPIVTGDENEPTIVSGGRLAVPADLELRWVLRAGSELFLRYGATSP
jgi:riboflavin-specific deaminase-like protein